MESVKDLIVDANAGGVSIALMENHRLIELNQESSQGHNFAVGDVYLGKVKKLLPSLNAAFVDIGDEKEAFVHYLDLGLYFKAFDEFVRRSNPNSDLKGMYSHIKIGPVLEKEGRIENVLSPKISSKEEKRRLETLVRNILPKNYGAIIRTAAEGKNAAVLDAEIMTLVDKWEKSWTRLARSKSVQLLFTEYSKTTTILRDLLNDSFSNIYVNDENVYEEIRRYISLISPEQEKIVKHYRDSQPIFDHFEVTRQIKSSFGKVVPIRQGAYLVIEHTEALHVIDVNSGTRSKNKEQEQNTYDVNCYAAEEIARQLRLRDMGGIVIVDFIDMESNEHRNMLYRHMQELMQNDRAKHNVLPLTKFGLMQITRQRVRPATEINTTEVCPVCHGTGKISSSVVIDEAIERRLGYYVKEKGIKSFVLKTNPILGAYLSRGIFSILHKWKSRYKCKIRLVEVTDFTVLQNEFYTDKGDRLDS